MKDKLSLKEKVWYGMGDLSGNIMFAAINFYLLYYFVKVQGIPAFEASAIFLIAKGWDAITDYMMGRICDATPENKYGKRINYLPYGTRAKLFVYLFIFTWIILKSIFYFIKYRPHVIVTTGTHTAVPMCYLGRLFGTKVVFIETFANRTKPSLSGRLIYPIASIFIVQWEEMKKFYPNAVDGGSIF